MSHFTVSLTVWAKSQDSVHKPQFLKTKESRSGSNRGPSANQPSALPLGHTGSPTNWACPLLFILFLCLFLSLWPFQLYSILWILPTTLCLVLCSSGLISALPVLSTKHLFMKVSFSPAIILCSWLGLKHQLTNCCGHLRFSYDYRGSYRR